MTTTRWLTPLLCTLPALRPARALLTPTWLVALAVLGVNDHLLKGAGLLPGVVTGKLSDLAGMVVAPALLAALLGLRSRRGVLGAHVAVAAVFAAIKLSPAAADAWSWLMGLVGFPWQIVVDPTDLLALPALALGWRALVPAMARPLPAVHPLLPRVGQTAALCAGTFLCVATSSPNDPPPGDDDAGEWDTGDIDYEDIEADVYVHNGTDRDITVRTRELLPSVMIDCLAVADDPAVLLSEPLFGEGRTWTMPPSTNVGVRDISVDSPRECFAALVEGDGLLEPVLLFWSAADLPIQYLDGDIDDPAQHHQGAVLLGDDADGRIVVTESRSEIVYVPDNTPPVDAVRPGLDVERLAWSDPPFGEHELTAVELGLDGCAAIEVDGGAAPTWYLCLPDGALPFAAGERVRVDGDAEGLAYLQVTRIAEDDAPVALVASRGSEAPELADVVLSHKADYGVDIAPELVCGTAARPGEVSVRFAGAAAKTARAGEKIELEADGERLTVYVAHAEERIILNPECAEGPDRLGTDLEFVAVRAAIEP